MACWLDYPSIFSNNQTIMSQSVLEPKIVLEKGKPASVILSITDYKNLLEKVEDAQDLKELRRLKKQELRFRPFSEFLQNHDI